MSEPQEEKLPAGEEGEEGESVREGEEGEESDTNDWEPATNRGRNRGRK